MAVAFCLLARAGPPRLLDIATPVGSTMTWTQRGHGMHYWWVTDRTVLTFRDLPEDRKHPYAGGRQLFLVDLPSHREQPLPKLTVLYRASGGNPDDTEISPDGKRLLWGCTGYDRWVSTLDGSDLSHCRSTPRTAAVWIPGTNRWAELAEDTGGWVLTEIRIHQPGTEPAPQAIVLPPGVRTGAVMAMPSANTLEIIRWTSVSGATDSVDLSQWSVDSSDSLRRSIMALPFLAYMNPDYIAFSPYRSRLAFFCWPVPSRLGSLLPRLFGRSAPPPQAYMWVCQPDGSKLHQVGVTDNASAMRWLPDGQRLSFVHGNTLYTVPVE